MNATCIETARQFNHLAPAAIRFAGKSYKRTKVTLYDSATDTVRFDFARRDRGAFLASKVVFSVRYNSSTDLYDIVAEHFDGASMESTRLRSVEGATFEVFAQPELLAR